LYNFLYFETTVSQVHHQAVQQMYISVHCSLLH